MSEAAPKHSGGRPSKFKKGFVKIAESMCELGETDEEVVRALGIRVSTFCRTSKTLTQVNLGQVRELYKRRGRANLGGATISQLPHPPH